MRPGDTWHVTFSLSGAATGTPTAKLLHNGATDTTVGSGGVITAAAGADANEWLVNVTIPASGYLANDSIEISATATVSGTTQSSIVGRTYIDPPVTVGTNSDKTGYALTTAPPTAGAITTAVVAGMASAPVGSVAGNVAGSVASVTAPVAINPAQVLNTPRALDAIADGTITVNDALWCAVVVAAGKESISGTVYTVKTPSTGSVIRTFTLDSGSAPTTRN